MARTNLASMSVDALLKLRDDIGKVLSRKARVSTWSSPVSSPVAPPSRRSPKRKTVANDAIAGVDK
jgi:hypothetical protein